MTLLAAFSKGGGASTSNANTWTGTQTFESIAAGPGFGKLQEIESYKESSTTGTSKTFTLAETNLDLYDALILTWSLTSTGALNLELILDGITSSYRQAITEDSAGTFSNSLLSAQAQFLICESSLITTDTVQTFGQVLIIPVEQNEGVDQIGIMGTSGVYTVGNSSTTGEVPATLSSLNTVKVEVSANAWHIHGRINLMGRLK